MAAFLCPSFCLAASSLLSSSQRTRSVLRGPKRCDVPLSLGMEDPGLGDAVGGDVGMPQPSWGGFGSNPCSVHIFGEAPLRTHEHPALVEHGPKKLIWENSWTVLHVHQPSDKLIRIPPNLCCTFPLVPPEPVVWPTCPPLPVLVSASTGRGRRSQAARMGMVGRGLAGLSKIRLETR